MEDEKFDYIVIGAGVNGSWTAYHLSKRGFKVLLLDQFPLPHSRGSSHGQTRGIRKAYYEYFYAEMMSDAYEQWHKLENESNSELLKVTGLLSFGPKNETAIRQMVDALEKLEGAKYEYFTSSDLSKRYPKSLSQAATKDLVGCIDHEAGLLMADKGLLALWNVATNKYKCTIIDSSPVKEIIPQSHRKHTNSITHCQSTVICTNGKRYGCQKVILCAGPWTNKLINMLSWNLPLEPVRINVCYYKANKHHFPHNFIFASDDESQDIWGLAEYEYPGMVKLCLHNGPPIDPDKRDNDKENAKDIRTRENFISTYFPCVDPKPSIQESCIYTVTPDRVHILDFHPQYDNIIVGCGFSGTGYKLGPVTGEMLADMALGVKTKYDRTPFLAKRFSKGNSNQLEIMDGKVQSKI